jgi:AraC-like DNA-binding protein
MIEVEEKLKIEIVEIKKIMDLLSSLFSIRTAFFYSISDEYSIKEIAGNMGDYQPFCSLIQQELRKKCIACDIDHFKKAEKRKSPLLYRCYNGLYEMILPLYIDEQIIGYLHFGQVRSEDSFEKIMQDCNLSAHSRTDLLKKAYRKMQIFPKEKLLLISDLFTRISEIILKNHLVEIQKAKPDYYLKKYINDNFSRRITIEMAARYIGLSTSYITHQFKKYNQCTFHQYLLNFRVNKASEFLKNKTIEETAEACGFKNRYHFSKIFKKYTGLTPKQFKKKSGI